MRYDTLWAQNGIHGRGPCELCCKSVLSAQSASLLISLHEKSVPMRGSDTHFFAHFRQTPSLRIVQIEGISDFRPALLKFGMQIAGATAARLTAYITIHLKQGCRWKERVSPLASCRVALAHHKFPVWDASGRSCCFGHSSQTLHPQVRRQGNKTTKLYSNYPS